MRHYHILSRTTGLRHAVTIPAGLTLAQSLYLAGAFSGRPLCSGLGRCGLCQARFLENAPDPLPAERARLSPERLAGGWRLTCLRPPVPDSLVEVELEADDAALTRMVETPVPDGAAALLLSPAPPGVPSPGGPGDAVLGVDLGTTSIHWRLERAGRALAQGSGPNPQMGAGCDVMARLTLADLPGGARRLRQAALSVLFRVLSNLPEAPARLGLAGNSVMTCLALGLDCSGLGRAPYALPFAGGAFVALYSQGPPVYVPPLLAPFVGGDVSAGLAALELAPVAPAPPYLLADLGTNGEFALVLPDAQVLVASVPMGPALEGVGMRQGVLAGPGAAVGFTLSPAGLAPRLYGGKAGGVQGVAAAGYLSLLAALVRAKVLAPDGRFPAGAASPLGARLLAGLGEEDGQPRLEVGGVKLFASDVETFLKVKAAFHAAVSALLDRAGLRFADLGSVLLAGALGENVRPEDLETLGFVPPGAAAKVRSVGNTSLAGACLAAADPGAREWLAGLPGRCQALDLAGAPDFFNRYLSAMRFHHE